MLIVRLTELKRQPDLFRASLQARIGPAAWGKSQMCWRSSQGRTPAKRAPLNASQGAVTDTAVGSALQGTKRPKTSSEAQRAVDLHMAASAAETRACSVRLLKGVEEAPYIEAGIPLAATKWQRLFRDKLRTEVRQSFPRPATTRLPWRGDGRLTGVWATPRSRKEAATSGPGEVRKAARIVGSVENSDFLHGSERRPSRPQTG